MDQSNIEKLQKELNELRAYKAAWEEAYPGITPKTVKQLEEQLFALYKERDTAKEQDLVTDYQASLDNLS